jgi:hypothetical protein
VVVDALKTQLADPRLLAEYLATYHEERRVEAKRAGSEAATLRKRLADVEASIMRYVNAVERGSMPEDIIVDRLQKLEAERVGLTPEAGRGRREGGGPPSGGDRAVSARD